MKTRLKLVKIHHNGESTLHNADNVSEHSKLENKETRHVFDVEVSNTSIQTPYKKEAAKMMSHGFEDYIKHHGYHFTDDLANFVSLGMENHNGIEHTWTTEQVKEVSESRGWYVGDSSPTKSTIGDVTYYANMLYANLYPEVFRDEFMCVKAAFVTANDPDGYDGMIFCRWISDAIGRGKYINWKDYI